MANNSDRWYFTKEQLDATPSRKAGYDSFKELSYRQQTANFIQDMGQRLRVSQLCINTAIVYMHRFYVFHSFTNFPWHQMAAAALFLAAKVEEQPRKLEYVIKVANMCRNSKDINIDVNSERYQAQSQDLVFNENVLLQTLGFDVAIDHPHTHVVRCCHLVRASRELAKGSYFMASNSLHLTTMCLQYKPSIVACFCIHLACKWSSWEIPLSTENKEWFLYIDPTVTPELLQQLTQEFLVIFQNCPSRLKEKIMAIGDNGIYDASNTVLNSPFDTDPKKIVNTDQKDSGHSTSSSSSSHRTHDKTGSEMDPNKHRSRPHDSSSSVISQQQREREYREKKEREKLAQQQHGANSSMKQLPPTQSSEQRLPSSHGHNHHRPSSSSSSAADQKLKQHSRQPSMSGSNSGGKSNSSSSSSSGGHPSSSSAAAAAAAAAALASRAAEPRDILREAARDSPFGIATKDFRDNSHNSSKELLREQARSSSNHSGDKDIQQKQQQQQQQRDYLLKPNAVGDSTNNIKNYSDARINNYNGDKRIDPNRVSSSSRSSLDPNKLSNKHENLRRHIDEKSSSSSSSFIKPDIDNSKKHLSANNHDNRNSGYVNKSSSSSLLSQSSSSLPLTSSLSSSSQSTTSTSLKVKSPFVIDNTSKSVPNKTSAANMHSGSSLRQQQLQQHNSISGNCTNNTNNNTNSGNLYGSLPLLETIKDEINIKDELPPTTTPTTTTTTTNVKRPSLFSPQKSPEIKRNSPPIINNKQQQQLLQQQQQSSFDLMLTDPLSPFQSPEQQQATSKRSRNYSTGSEPELRPVMKKIDQVQGFENLMRDSTIGINKLAQVPDIITPITDKEKQRDPILAYSKEMKPPDIIPPLSSSDNNTIINSSQPIVNGIETNPLLISSLLKEAPLLPQLPVNSAAIPIASAATTTAAAAAAAAGSGALLSTTSNVLTITKEKEKEHHHHKSKKKNKEKHKHKDKDRNREEKEKKKKHKDKDKHKHSKHEIVTPTEQPPPPVEPIKIKIQKDKIQPVLIATTTIKQPAAAPLKKKLPKDKLKTDSSSVVTNDHHTFNSSTITTQSNRIGGLKIKIPKEKINNCNNSSSDLGGSSNSNIAIISNNTTTTTSNSSSSSSSSSSSRKRDRDRSSPGEGPSVKMSRSSSSHHHHHKEAKQNGRHSYNKVTQLGDGDASIHRLVDSKYISKNSSS